MVPGGGKNGETKRNALMKAESADAQATKSSGTHSTSGGPEAPTDDAGKSNSSGDQGI
jgi:hypothetical protein